MGGFFGGLLAGAAVVLCVSVGASLLMPLSPQPEVASETPTAVPAQPEAAEVDVAQPGPDADLVDVAPRAPDGPENESDTIAASTGADTQPGNKPDITETTAGLTGPEAGAAPELEVEAEKPVSQTAAIEAPAIPEQDETPSVSTEAPEPPAPEPAEPPVVTRNGEPSVLAEATPPALITPQAPEGQQPPTAPELPAAEPEAPLVPEVETEAAETESDSPRLAALPPVRQGTGSETSTRIGTPVVPLTDRHKTVSAPGVGELGGEPPISAYAVGFDNPEEKPLMSIVLIDDDAALGVEALREFPYPLTFAVDPTKPDAAEKMASHRAAGFEVVMLTDMPLAATAQDAEVSLSVWMEAVPETVALLEGTRTGIQGNRPLSDQITAIAGGTGRGLITQGKGLNTVQKLAAREGVPSTVVFRDFDGAGQTPTVMRRFLDQAAFRAGQEGAVVMLGRVRPDTVSALLLWGLQDRASRVALAPVSAVLTQGAE
ncbi:divergent polysaccharide deacetylase family protein [Ruegeria jejuensis]|uniref:divergent polysaccharide deacetylase family protein n=1 Tax=Ruegeria jejuensis TaxID=3233338 RepID=UPI00355B0084